MWKRGIPVAVKVLKADAAEQLNGGPDESNGTVRARKACQPGKGAGGEAASRATCGLLVWSARPADRAASLCLALCRGFALAPSPCPPAGAATWQLRRSSTHPDGVRDSPLPRPRVQKP